MKAAAYIRVSTAEQEDGASLTEQKRDIEEYCNLKGYELVATYQDIASGASRNRPQFKAMLKDARTGAFQIIVAWKADRLYRGGGPAYALKEALTGTDIKLEAVKDTIDPKYFGLLAEIGGLERESIIERTRMGARGRARAGKVHGTPKYGYQSDDEGFPQVNPAESQIVERIFEEYLNGSSCARIARMLTDEGILNRNGKAWTAGRIHSVVSDPVYTGKGQYGRTQNIYRDSGETYIKEKKHTPEDSWIEIPYPAIIDESIFKKAQVIRRNQTRERNGIKERVSYPLKGVLWCGDCGHLYSTQTSRYLTYYTRKDGTKVRTRSENTFRRKYICIRSARYGAGCTRPKLNANKVEVLVWRWFNLWLVDHEHVDSLIEKRRQYLAENGVEASLVRHREALASLDQEKTRLLTAYQKGYLSEGDLDIRMKQIREGQEYYQGEIDRIKGEVDHLQEAIDALECIRQHDQLQIVFALEPKSEQEKLEILRKCVDRIIVDKEGITATVNIGKVTEVLSSLSLY
jgi:DNA invertase Pin-like site-specific DNA recombinase